MRRLAVLGAGGHGKVVAEIAELSGWQEIVFYDDAWPSLTHVESWAVVGNTDILVDSLTAFEGVFVAIGDNHLRLNKLNFLKQKGALLVSLIHPSATLSSYSTIGEGGVVMAGATINPYTHAGDGVIVNTGANIDHDCKLGSAVHVSPGACLGGGVLVGDLSWIGMGSAVIQQVSIGKQVVVGAGSTVIESVSDYSKVVGSPARPINLT